MRIEIKNFKQLFVDIYASGCPFYLSYINNESKYCDYSFDGNFWYPISKRLAKKIAKELKIVITHNLRTPQEERNEN